MDEAKLLAGLWAGKRGALDQAVSLYTSYVSAAAWRTSCGTATREDLEEIVSDVFLALWSHAGELSEEKGGLRPWLGTVARNKTISFFRRRREVFPLSDTAPDASPGPEEETARQDEAARLWRAVESLDEPERDIFLRYYLQEESTGEIAAALKLNRSTVKTKLIRGRETLRKALTKGGFGYETSKSNLP